MQSWNNPHAADRPDLDAAAIVGLLAEPARLRVVAAMALGAAKLSELAARTGLSDREVAAAVSRLEAGGLITNDGGVLTLDEAAFRQAARLASATPPGPDFGAAYPADEGVLRAFIRDGRLRQVPAQASKRKVVLEYIVTVFEPGVRYAEREVNALLSVWYSDYATLRRYLVDEGLLTREHGIYWRTGGWVDLGT